MCCTSTSNRSPNTYSKFFRMQLLVSQISRAGSHAQEWQHGRGKAKAALQDWSWELQFMGTSFRQSGCIPTSAFQYLFNINPNRDLPFFSNKEQFFPNGETLATKTQPGKQHTLKCVFRACSYKSSLINAAFCLTLTMHISQDLVGKEEKDQVLSALYCSNTGYFNTKSLRFN